VEADSAQNLVQNGCKNKSAQRRPNPVQQITLNSSGINICFPPFTQENPYQNRKEKVFARNTIPITNDNKKLWRLFKIRGSWEEYYVTLRQLPERLKQLVPFVVEALPTFRRHKINRVLDLGCGAGRHCVYLAENDFDVVGVDVSKSALRMAKEWVRRENLKNATFVQASMTDIPFCDSQFDGVISVSVIHHALKRDIVKAVDEIFRILKKKGLFLANLTSVTDPRYGAGDEVEARTFRTLEAFEEKRFRELHHYFTEQEASQLVARFARAKVEPMKDRLNYWKITAIK